MPNIPPRACIRPMCRAVSHDGSSYCAKHKPKQDTGWDKHRAKHGNSRHKAGYGSNWDKLRKAVLVRDRYLCQTCLRLGVMREAKQVDHKLPKSLGGTNELTNLEAICYPCHKIKTNKEAAAARLKSSQEQR